jgi:hypothetical protein
MTENDRTGLRRRSVKSKCVRGQLNMIVVNHRGRFPHAVQFRLEDPNLASVNGCWTSCFATCVSAQAHPESV